MILDNPNAFVIGAVTTLLVSTTIRRIVSVTLITAAAIFPISAEGTFELQCYCERIARNQANLFDSENAKHGYFWAAVQMGSAVRSGSAALVDGRSNDLIKGRLHPAFQIQLKPGDTIGGFAH